MLAIGPITLPLEEAGNGRHTGRTRLDHAAERSFVGRDRGGTTAVIDHVDVVTFAEHFNRRPRDANFRPETRHDNVLLARGLDGGAKASVVPRVHRGTFNDFLTVKDVQEHGPNVTREAFRFDSRQNGRNVVELGALGQQRDLFAESSRKS